MAACLQERVHAGASYDMLVDTTDTPAAECAMAIAAMVRA
ncbi:MAG: phosphotransferase-like protein [Acidimicrobiales bacterium]